MGPRGNGPGGSGYNPSRQGNTNGRRILNAIDVEADIMRLSGEIDDLLTDLDNNATDAARAEYDWEYHRATEGLVASAEPGNGPGGRTTVDEREARVIERDHAQLYLKHLTTERMYNVTKERIHAKRDQMRALQTIAANIRAVTTGGGA